MEIGGAAAGQLHRRHDIGRLDRREEPFKEERLLGGRLAQAQSR